jgi:hypothetical protein
MITITVNTFITTHVFNASLLGSVCLAVDRQGQGDTRFILTPSVIPNSNYVIMVSDWNCLNIFACFCTVIIRCRQTFWSLCILKSSSGRSGVVSYVRTGGKTDVTRLMLTFCNRFANTHKIENLTKIAWWNIFVHLFLELSLRKGLFSSQMGMTVDRMLCEMWRWFTETAKMKKE